MTSFFQRQPDVTPSYTLRALAHLLSYPGAELRAVVPELQQVLANEGAVSDQRLLGLNKRDTSACSVVVSYSPNCGSSAA